jgi:hypothetical protein
MKKNNINPKLVGAFNELTLMGYTALHNHACCNSCGWAEIDDAKAEKAVFYHRQNTQDLQEKNSCHLSWSGNGEEIVSVLQKHGIKTEWDGNENKKIFIDLN